MSIPTKRLDSLDPTINPQRDHEVAAMRDGISNKLRIEQILALLQSSDIPDGAISTEKIEGVAVTLAKLAADARAASGHTFDDTTAQLGETNVQGAIDVLALGYRLRGAPIKIEESGTYTPDLEVKAIWIEAQAGGGGGGGTPSTGSGQAAAAGGGGGGECAFAFISDPSGSYSVVIGAGGPGGAGNSDGGDGSDTTFGSVLTAKGGKGGLRAGAAGSLSGRSAGSRGEGGTGGTGDTLIPGGDGGVGMANGSLSAALNIGVGGSSQFCGAAVLTNVVVSVTDGPNARGFGGGGCGAAGANSQPAGNGGGGGDGLVRIWEFK